MHNITNTPYNLNDAPAQKSFELIPQGTLAKVYMTIIPGGYDDPSKGWTGGYATRNANTGSVYLQVEFRVIDGEYEGRKLWSLIGLHSEKGPKYAEMGKTLIRAIIESKKGISSKDDSVQAKQARKLNGFHELDNIIFAARIDIRKDEAYGDKNEIRYAITAEHPEYARLTASNSGEYQRSNFSTITPQQKQIAETAGVVMKQEPQKGGSSFIDDEIPF